MDNETVVHLALIEKSSGSSMLKTIYKLTIPCFLLFFSKLLCHVTMHSKLKKLNYKLRYSIHFIIEYSICLLSSFLIGLTVFSDPIIYYSFIILYLLTTYGVVRAILPLSFSTQKATETVDEATFKQLIHPTDKTRQLFISYFRGTVRMFSGMIVFATDFKFFWNTSTETATMRYGVLNAGVGLFIVSSAIVSKFPNQKENIVKIEKNICTLITLGVGRYVHLIICDYHMNEKQYYGTHWNFFISLAIVKAVSFKIFRLCNYEAKNVFLLTTCLLFIHQYLLNCGVRDWIFSDVQQDDIITTNREGIVSLLGYEILYLFAVLLKHDFLPQGKPYKVTDVLPKLFSISIVFMMAHLYFDSVDPMSRRTINASYVFWILTLATVALFTCLIIETLSKKFGDQVQVSIILQAVNDHSLIYFLTSYLLVGIDVINLVFPTDPAQIYVFIITFALIFSFVFFVNLIIYSLYKFHTNQIITFLESLFNKQGRNMRNERGAKGGNLPGKGRMQRWGSPLI